MTSQDFEETPSFHVPDENIESIKGTGAHDFPASIDGQAR
jgi:hypothetical protein